MPRIDRSPSPAPAAPPLLAAVLVLTTACGTPVTAPESTERPPLRIALPGEPSALDPHLQTDAVAQSVLGNVYESLVAFDADMSIVPALAERWENPDDLTWRFHLRPGVRFHDGSPLTIDDVVTSLERARHHPRSKAASYLVAVEEVRAAGETALEVRTAAPYPILLNKLGLVSVVPMSAPEEILTPIGTGPYVFAGFEPGGPLSLEASDGYWRGRAAEPAVEIYFVPESERRVAMLLAGEVDLINELPAREMARIEAAGGCRVAARSSLWVEYLQMDLASEPFSDPQVRRALDLAIDRRALVEELLLGQGRPLGQMVSPDVFGYAPGLEAPERDLETARRLLAEAGHGGGLTLTLEHREGRPVERLRAQLAEAGVELETVARPWNEMYPRLSSGEVAFYFGGWVSVSADASDLLDHKVHTPDPARGYGASNSNRFSSPELDRLIEETDTTLDMARRGEVLERALELLAESRAFLPLYTPHELYGLDAELRWRPRQDARIYAYEIRR